MFSIFCIFFLFHRVSMFSMFFRTFHVLKTFFLKTHWFWMIHIVLTRNSRFALDFVFSYVFSCFQMNFTQFDTFHLFCCFLPLIGQNVRCNSDKCILNPNLNFHRFWGLWGPAGTCGDMRGPAGTCGDLRGPAGTCGDLRGPAGTWGGSTSFWTTFYENLKPWCLALVLFDFLQFWRQTQKKHISIMRAWIHWFHNKKY